nr:serine/arginine repetitive matrix protein 3-like [Macaca nemestrina]
MALRARGLAALAGERAGRRLGGCALSSISASGGGSRGEAEGAGPRGPRSCPAQPSPGQAAARTSGTRGPGPSARQIAAVSGEGQRPRPAAPGPATMSSTVNNGAASMPSPPDAANGFPQPSASSGTWPRAEEELRTAEPGLVKRAHREILDHERKRRVELKCMELQEMMEEQGYSEEEIRQKVGTFRQMLMEKEGVLTREDRPGGHM